MAFRLDSRNLFTWLPTETWAFWVGYHNQLVIQYLKTFTNLREKDWVDLKPVGQAAVVTGRNSRCERPLIRVLTAPYQKAGDC
jgi:hypothetical protein